MRATMGDIAGPRDQPSTQLQVAFSCNSLLRGRRQIRDKPYMPMGVINQTHRSIYPEERAFLLRQYPAEGSLVKPHIQQVYHQLQESNKLVH